MDLKDIYYIEFNNFNDIIFFNEDSILYSKNVHLLKSSYHTENEFLNPIVSPLLEVIELTNSKGKEYIVKSLTRTSMQIEYQTVSLERHSKEKLKESYVIFKYLNNTLYGKTKDEKWYELQENSIVPVKVLVYLSKSKNQNILNEFFFNNKNP